MKSQADVVRACQALSDPTRIELLRIVGSSPLPPTATDLISALGMSQPRIARHLKILVDAGVLSSVRQGRFVRYSLATEGMASRIAVAALGQESPPPPPRPSPPEPVVQRSPIRPVAESHPALEPVDETEDSPPGGSMEDFLL